MFGPLLVALILAVTRHDYTIAFAVLAVPGAITVTLVLVARTFYPRPHELSAGPAEVTTSGLPGVFWVYLAGAALVAAGFADFPVIAYHFSRAGTVSAPLVPVFYAAAMAVSGAGSLLFGRMFDRAGIGILIPLTVVAAAYAPLAFLGGFWASLVGVSLWGLLARIAAGNGAQGCDLGPSPGAAPAAIMGPPATGCRHRHGGNR
jgi:hypothetical protein